MFDGLHSYEIVLMFLGIVMFVIVAAILARIIHERSLREAGGACRRAQPPRGRLRHPLARTPRCARRTGRGGPTARGPAGTAPCATRPVAPSPFVNNTG